MINTLIKDIASWSSIAVVISVIVLIIAMLLNVNDNTFYKILALEVIAIFTGIMFNLWVGLT